MVQKVLFIANNGQYRCPQGSIVPFKKVFNDYRTGTKKKEYRISSKICKDCPVKRQCLGKTEQEKKFSVTYYREKYERNSKRGKSKQGQYMKTKRQSTVKPVFRTLTQFMGLRKINTIGLAQANKVMHLSAIAYNLKKYLKFTSKIVKSDAKSLVSILIQHIDHLWHKIGLYNLFENIEMSSNKNCSSY